MSDMSCSLSLSITKTNSKTNTKTKTTDVLWRPPRLFNVLIRLLTKSPREGGVGLEYLHLSGVNQRCAGTSFTRNINLLNQYQKTQVNNKIASHSGTGATNTLNTLFPFNRY